jgi:hypothetical protein
VTVPNTTGTYEFRLYKQGSFVRLATSPTVTVSGPAPVIAVSQTTVAPGGSVTATLSNNGAPPFAGARGCRGAGRPTSVGCSRRGPSRRAWTLAIPTAGHLRVPSACWRFDAGSNSPPVIVRTGAQLSVVSPLPSPVPPSRSRPTDWAAARAGWPSRRLAPRTTATCSSSTSAGVTTRTADGPDAGDGWIYEFRLFQQGTFNRLAESAGDHATAAAGPDRVDDRDGGRPTTVTLTNGQAAASTGWRSRPCAADNSYVQFTCVGAGVTTRTWTVAAPTAGNTVRLYGRVVPAAGHGRPGGGTGCAAAVLGKHATAAPGQSVTVTLTNSRRSDRLAGACGVGAPTASTSWTYRRRRDVADLDGDDADTGHLRVPPLPAGGFVRAATSPPVVVQWTGSDLDLMHNRVAVQKNLKCLAAVVINSNLAPFVPGG